MTGDNVPAELLSGAREWLNDGGFAAALACAATGILAAMVEHDEQAQAAARSDQAFLTADRKLAAVLDVAAAHDRFAKDCDGREAYCKSQDRTADADRYASHAAAHRLAARQIRDAVDG